jgi:predicted Zn-dependent protease
MSKRGNLDFELGFFESLHKRLPKDKRVVTILAHLYTETGRIDSGLKMDRKLARLSPDDPTVHYNLACSLALKGRLADAVRALRTAASLEYDDYHWMCNDPDLKALDAYPGFLKFCDDLGIG